VEGCMEEMEEGWKDGRMEDDGAERQPKVRPVLVLEAQRSMGPALVRPLRFGALFSLSPPIQV